MRNGKTEICWFTTTNQTKMAAVHQSSHFPDLASYDFLFPKIKFKCKGKGFNGVFANSAISVANA
jgi:hypothetical protein